jgi:hypothetical protein
LDWPLLMKNRITVATFVPSARILMVSRREPFGPAVNTVVTAPVPSFAVFAVATVPYEITGVTGKIG